MEQPLPHHDRTHDFPTSEIKIKCNLAIRSIPYVFVCYYSVGRNQIKEVLGNIPSANIIPNSSLEIITCIEVNGVRLLKIFEQLFHHGNDSGVTANTFIFIRTRRWWPICAFKPVKLTVLIISRIYLFLFIYNNNINKPDHQDN